jgi:hypothetical protein
MSFIFFLYQLNDTYIAGLGVRWDGTDFTNFSSTVGWDYLQKFFVPSHGTAYSSNVQQWTIRPVDGRNCSTLWRNASPHIKSCISRRNRTKEWKRIYTYISFSICFCMYISTPGEMVFILKRNGFF